jgi:hypothetical protein
MRKPRFFFLQATPPPLFQQQQQQQLIMGLEAKQTSGHFPGNSIGIKLALLCAET